VNQAEGKIYLRTVFDKWLAEDYDKIRMVGSDFSEEDIAEVAMDFFQAIVDEDEDSDIDDCDEDADCCDEDEDSDCDDDLEDECDDPDEDEDKLAKV
jgi:hypothetical protein